MNPLPGAQAARLLYQEAKMAALPSSVIVSLRLILKDRATVTRSEMVRVAIETLQQDMD